MKQKSAEEIMAASKPRDIFSMNALTLEQEKDEYVERFKPKEYNTIKYFLATQKVILLYRQALEELEKGEKIEETMNRTTYIDEYRKKYRAQYIYDTRIGTMFVNEDSVFFVIPPENKEYYKNYIEKIKKFPEINRESVHYVLPRISRQYEDENDNGIIVLNKSLAMRYSLREILNYVETIPPEYVVHQHLIDSVISYII